MSVIAGFEEYFTKKMHEAHEKGELSERNNYAKELGVNVDDVFKETNNNKNHDVQCHRSKP